MYATREGWKAVVIMLLKYGAPVHLVDEDGHSALWRAKSHVVQTLLNELETKVRG